MTGTDRTEEATVNKPSQQERVIVSLPKALAEELQKYAGLVHGGNKSGFVADAIRAYIDHLDKARHTAKLRQSYAAAAGETRASVEEWAPLVEEAWERLDALETKPKKAR
jgi:metal-responsive CopG/Arc/MetJ family transcriptional regulator